MPNPAFALPEDLVLLLNRDLDPKRALLFLELASDEVRGYLAQTVHRVEGDTVDLLPRGGGLILLPELPVWDVTDVTEVINGVSTELVAGTDYRLEAGHDGRNGILRRLGGRYWPSADSAGDSYITVTYDHGYDVDDTSAGADHPLPGIFRTVTLRVSTRGITNPAGMRQESIGRYSYTSAGAGDSVGAYLTLGDQADLDPYLPGTRAGARA